MKRTILITLAVLFVFGMWTFTMIASAAVGYSAGKDEVRRTQDKTEAKFACVEANITSPTTRPC